MSGFFQQNSFDQVIVTFITYSYCVQVLIEIVNSSKNKNNIVTNNSMKYNSRPLKQIFFLYKNMELNYFHCKDNKA